MQIISNDIETICVGMAASAGALLLAGGTKGKRLILPHSKVMIHETNIGGMGHATTSQVGIQYEEMKASREAYASIIAKHTGQKIDKVRKDLNKDTWFSAEEAISYGLVDKIIKK